MYKIRQTNRYAKSVFRLIKQGKDLSKLDKAVEILEKGDILGEEYSDHPLKGKWAGYRDCHIGGKKSDWILIYKIEKDILVLELTNTGTHREVGVGENFNLK